MKIPAIGDTVQGDNRMNTSQKASRLHGMGFLPLFGSAMATTTKDGEGRVFSFRSVLWRLLLIAVLSGADMALQAWWTVSSGSVSYDPWWAGLLGWSSYDFNVTGVIASLFALSLAPGFLMFFIGLFFNRIRWVFLTSMVLLISGISRMLGTGLGRTILYVQVRDGLLSADAVRSGTNYVGLSSSAVVADSWPVVAAAIVFAAVALALALLSRNRHGGGTASRLWIGGNAAIVVGLLGITLVECGLMPTTLVLVAMAAFVAFLWLPGEVRVARACEADRVGAVWEWHAASLIWLETLVIFMFVIFGILKL